jgi:prepilin-type processing-associated H-X9-DG protein
VDSEGNRLHSWRTLILPYLGQKNLYDQIDLTKPWDDPANLPLTATTIITYVCPSQPLQPGMTNYLAPTHPQGILADENATKISEITDGISSTILVVEVENSQAVYWMEPKDIDGTLFPGNIGAHPGGGHAAMADGSVTFFSNNVPPPTRNAMLTKDGKEALNAP